MLSDVIFCSAFWFLDMTLGEEIMDEKNHIYFSAKKIVAQLYVGNRPLEDHILRSVNQVTTHCTQKKTNRKRSGGASEEKPPSTFLLQLIPRCLWRDIIDGLMAFRSLPSIA